MQLGAIKRKYPKKLLSTFPQKFHFSLAMLMLYQVLLAHDYHFTQAVFPQGLIASVIR